MNLRRRMTKLIRVELPKCSTREINEAWKNYDIEKLKEISGNHDDLICTQQYGL